MKTKQDYLNLLKETVNYYTVEKNERALDEDGNCVYFTKGKMCAVGRCLVKPQDKDEKLIDFNGQTDVDTLLKRFKSTIFKKEYRGFDLRIWEHLQNFHDTNSYFNEFKLTELGKYKVKEIKNYIEKKFAE